MRGDSMAPRILPGQVLTVIADPGRCLPLRRGDLVLYSDAGHPDAPLLKAVRGLPGDRLAVARDPGGLYRIVVNGLELNNSTGAPYRLEKRVSKMLRIYEKGYRGVIPAGAYLLLGEAATGSRDSTRFGLVGRKGIVGRAVPPVPATRRQGLAQE